MNSIRRALHRRRPGARVLPLALAGAVTLAACTKEAQPPQPGPPAPIPAPAPPAPVKPAQCAGSTYRTLDPVDHYFKIGLDMRDVRAAMASGDWDAAILSYANGKNQFRPDGSVRSLASLAVTAHEQIPHGVDAHKRASFIDAMIRDGLRGVGRAHGNSDDVRKAAVEHGMAWVVYGKVLEELANTEKAIAAKELDDVKGAPHTVDESWAAIAGAPDDKGARSHGLLGLAAVVEESLGLQGQLCVPLENALVAAQAAARAGDGAAFAQRRGEIVGLLHAVFYGHVRRALALAEVAPDEDQRRASLAAAWSAWQPLRATVHARSPDAAQLIEATLTRPAREPFPAAEGAKVRAALQDDEVWKALAIPSPLKATEGQR